MYFVFGKVFWMFDNDLDASAEFLTPLPEIKPHWWDAQPIQTSLPPLTLGVDRRVPMFDNYPVQSPLNLYSSKLISIIESAGVRFEAFPVSLVDISNYDPLPYQYSLFHLLEMYPAINKSQSNASSLVLNNNILSNPRPLFRPLEIPTVMFIHKNLRVILEENTISGCLYDSISYVSNLLV